MLTQESLGSAPNTHITSSQRIRNNRKKRHDPRQQSERPLRAVRERRIAEEKKRQQRKLAQVHTIGVKTYDKLVRHNRKVKAREAYRLALRYILIDRDFVNDLGQVLMPDYKVACWCESEGGVKQYINGNFNAGAFIRELTVDVLPGLVTSGYRGPDREGNKGECRYIANSGIDDLVEYVILDHDESERYDLVSMSRWNYANAKKNRDRLIAEALKQTWPYLQQVPIAHYLHTRPFGLFTKQLSERIAEAREYIKLSPDLDGKQKRRQYRILRRIEDNPQPVYRPGLSMRSPRLFAHDSLCDVERGARRILCRGWHEVDLTSCYPAIAARIWHIERLQSMIERGVDVWNAIAGELGIAEPEREDKRDVVKEVGCRLLCGGHIDKTNEVLAKHGIHGVVEDSITLMTIVKAVREVRRHVRARGGTQTPMGWIACPSRKDKPLRSHLSNVLAAYELALIAPCFEVAERSQDFTITICQHDGFSIKLRWEDRARQVLDRLNDAVAPVARLYGIVTHLEYKT